MAKSQKLTRRQALLLGLGTATTTVLPHIEFGNFHNQALAKPKKTPPAKGNPPVNTSPPPVTSSNGRDFTVVGSGTLKERAAAKEVIYGTASSRAELSSDQQFSTAVLQESAMLQATIDLSWERVHPSLNEYNFVDGDWLAEYARTHGILLGGGHFVYPIWPPAWLKETVNQQNGEQILVDHIQKVAGHYAGKVNLWSVVNEVVAPEDGRDDGLRNSLWLNAIGPEHIEVAFNTAAQADPNAFLIYNEWGLEYKYPDQEAKRTSVLKLLEQLKSKGVRIDGLGIQSHLWADMANFDPQILQNFLKEVANLGLKILVTEMDVIDKNMPADIQTRDQIVAGMYQDFLTVYLNEPAVINITTWGLSDKYTWHSWNSPRSDGAAVRPLPLDAGMNRKLAWNAIANAFEAAPKHQPSSL